MKNVLLIILYFNLSMLSGQDNSTPIDGNLIIDSETPFLFRSMEIYENESILRENNINIQNNRIFTDTQKRTEIKVKNRTVNTDIAWIDNKTFVVLTGNTERYSHGILGDKIESTGFDIYENGRISAAYELPENQVFETLRPLIADLIPENPGKEIILTTSNKIEGARVEVYSQNGILIGKSKSIGRGYRWLHVLGVAQFDKSSKKYLALVKTPHINGVLELYKWNGDFLVRIASINNISTHQIGSDNLNMALLINMDDSIGSELLLPAYDFKSLLVIKYDDENLKEIHRFNLPDKLSTNIYFDEKSPPSIWFGTSDGSIVRISE